MICGVNQQVLSNGDLLIRHVSWASNMGLYRCVPIQVCLAIQVCHQLYRCVADNGVHSDHVDTFLYPVRSVGYDLKSIFLKSQFKIKILNCDVDFKSFL